ncbi:MAG: hypothetical protein ACOX7D_02330 [Alphaproteobacteria bacterium]|jgi:hypothetical protein
MKKFLITYLWALPFAIGFGLLAKYSGIGNLIKSYDLWFKKIYAQNPYIVLLVLILLFAIAIYFGWFYKKNKS